MVEQYTKLGTITTPRIIDETKPDRSCLKIHRIAFLNILKVDI